MWTIILLWPDSQGYRGGQNVQSNGKNALKGEGLYEQGFNIFFFRVLSSKAEIITGGLFPRLA